MVYHFALSTTLSCVILFLGGLASASWNYSTVTEHCQDLWNYTIDPGFECQTTVTNVTLIPAHNGVPSFCRVSAMVNQFTGVLLFLPAAGKDWKGTYSAEGCGGACGTTAYGLEIVQGFGTGLTGEQVVQRGYVASTTDMGHQNAPVGTKSDVMAIVLMLDRTRIATV
jgi:hypothetical protein